MEINPHKTPKCSYKLLNHLDSDRFTEWKVLFYVPVTACGIYESLFPPQE